jgi:hypothetical protein
MLHAESFGESKMKMTYSEQLRHPNWQRVRLEVLNASDWQCGICGSKDKMLHVHHKQYIKGRMAWEYEISNFDALCDVCHSETHDTKALINEILASIPSDQWMAAASLLAGRFADKVSEDVHMRVYDAHAFEAGRLAHVAGALDIFDLVGLTSHLTSLLPLQEPIFPDFQPGLDPTLPKAD